MFNQHYNAILTSMKPEMNPETALCSEQLLTNLALEVFNTRMCFGVSRQRALNGK